ncbi:hypothetical protein B5K03_10490 [Rhizobium phaseoli]|nr:hypothetical protein B5K03_10490 [Rhizobium phaseoli]
MLGLEPSIHTAFAGSRGMGPRFKAEDDGEWGWLLSKLGLLYSAVPAMARDLWLDAGWWPEGSDESAARHILHCPSLALR